MQKLFCMDIKSIVKRHGFTMKEVADRMTSLRGNSVSRGNFSNTVNHGNPTIAYLQQIADVIGASRAEFFEDELPNTYSNHFAHTITLDGKRYGLVPLDD